MIDRTLVETAARMRRQGEPYLVATVVRGRRPGTRLLLGRYRWYAAAASGGAFDGELSASAWMHTKDTTPVVMTYDAAHPDIANDEDLLAAFDLGEDGVVDVMLERAGAPGQLDVLELATRCTRQQRRAAVATVISAEGTSVRIGSRLALLAGGDIEQDGPLDSELRDAICAELRVLRDAGTTCLRSFDGVEVLLEAVTPPPRLFVIGESHDLVPLAQLARISGWEVVICTEAPRHATRERFVTADEILVGDEVAIALRIDQSDRAACIVATHATQRDRTYLNIVRSTKAHYIGMADHRVARLAPDDGRIHELHGETAQDRAFAAIADARASLAAASHGDRAGPGDDLVRGLPSAMFAAASAS